MSQINIIKVIQKEYLVVRIIWKIEIEELQI